MTDAPRPPAMRRHDTGPVLLAAVVWAGASVAIPVPSVAVAVATVAAVLRRRWLVLLVAGALAASWGSARSWEGLAAPLPASVDDAVGVLRADPEPLGGRGRGVRVDVDVSGRRYEARAYGSVAARLRGRSAGDRVRLSGSVAAVDHDDARWLVPRHVAGRLTLVTADPVADARGPLAVANGVRALLERGRSAGGLTGDLDAVTAGLTTGDDRFQSDQVTADVRATGLSHLMAVSGQNVAVVLAVALALVSRRSPRTRLVVLGAVLVVFTLVTRWEASVLRATAMAALALGAQHLGRPATPVRLLALAVSALVLSDPLLVHSIGFRLSVAATAGIVLGASRIERRLAGPGWLRQALSVTLAAQMAVLPIQLVAFGRPPLVSVATNALAGPAAGAVMVWGVAAGAVAGVAGGPLALVAHLPTRLLVSWVLGVARVGAAVDAALVAGIERVTPVAAIGAVACVGGLAAWRRPRRLPADSRVAADGSVGPHPGDR